MIIYLDRDFNPVPKEQAAVAKIVPEDGSMPYFVAVEPPFVLKGLALDEYEEEDRRIEGSR